MFFFLNFDALTHLFYSL